jgi:acetoin utilization protein AcuA
LERFLSREALADLLKRLPDLKVLEETRGGTLSIIPNCPLELFSGLQVDSGIGNFAHYSSIIQKRDVFEKIASEDGGRVALALVEGRTIVGYAACWYPGEDQRWSRLGHLMYEMGALEVSRNYRKMRIASRMVGTVMEDEDFFGSRIAYMNGFVWHWDLVGCGLNMQEYRTMMIGLLKARGFEECYTNEPNIALREENVFMVRTGSAVSEEDRNRFRNLRFGIMRK